MVHGVMGFFAIVSILTFCRLSVTPTPLYGSAGKLGNLPT